MSIATSMNLLIWQFRPRIVFEDGWVASQGASTTEVLMAAKLAPIGAATYSNTPGALFFHSWRLTVGLVPPLPKSTLMICPPSERPQGAAGPGPATLLPVVVQPG